MTEETPAKYSDRRKERILVGRYVGSYGGFYKKRMNSLLILPWLEIDIQY